MKKIKEKSSETQGRDSKKEPKKNKRVERTGKTQEIPVKSQKSTKEPQTMDELLKTAGIVAFSMKKFDMVKGTVISNTSREVLVDIGKKSYGIVAEWELEQVKDYAKTLKPGDKITAQVINPENDFGYTVLSLRKASAENRWSLLEEYREAGTDIEVMGLESAKGGILVDWNNLRGFIPSTQLDGASASNPYTLIGRRIKVKVIEVDKSMNRLVLSQKASILGVTPANLKKKLEKIKPKDVLKGTISGVAQFGIFVDVDGIEGLVHISEVAWEKVDNLEGMFKVGSQVEVVVIDVNKVEGKLNLSMKRLTPDPWKNILDKYPIDSQISGKVVRMAAYGVFVQLEPGIEGLLHISKLIPGEEPQVGEEIQCLVEKIDTIKRKISLTLVPTEKPVGYR